MRNSNSFTNYLRKEGCEIGENCFFQQPSSITIDISRPILVSIGNNCRFLKNFTLLTHDSVNKVLGNIYHEFLPSSGSVKIGNNVYFARNCSVLKGVEIGDNCIIGYGSIVTKNIPANSVAVGIPARVVCSLDNYFERRKEQAQIEAFKLVQTYYKKTGKRPTVEQMFEEFPFWMEGDYDDSRLRFSVKYQTRGYYEYWKKNHKAPYSSFDDFIDDALKNIK